MAIICLAGAAGLTPYAKASDEDPGAKVSVERDIRYAGDLTLDLHRPMDVTGPAPAVIVIHGGAFSEGLDRSVMDELSSRIAADGYVVANVSYRLLAPEGGVNRWPAQLEDARAALGWLRSNADARGVVPDRICAVGHSSGGQLAALLGLRDGSTDDGTTSAPVSCVVSLAGVTDPAAFFADGFVAGPFDPRPPTLDLLAGSPEDVPDAYEDASPLAWVEEDAAPFLILHGTSDVMLPVTQSRRMVEALRDADVEVVYEEFPGSDHFDTLRWDISGSHILAFLEGHLRTVG